MHPQLESAKVVTTVAQYAGQVAHALKFSDKYGTLQESSSFIAANTHFGSSGLQVKISNTSDIHSSGRDWDPSAPCMDISSEGIGYSSEVSSGKELLIYLAAAIAIAHADELSPPDGTAHVA